MSDWKKALNHLVADVEQQYDNLRYRLHAALGGADRIKIIPYRGYGTPQRLFLKGRVLEDKHIPEAETNDNLWENMLNMYKRLESDEIPNARLVARYEGVEQEVVADREGFFEVWIEPSKPPPQNRVWHSVELELLDPLPNDQRGPIMAVGQVLVPPPTARFGVISDIDDTVLKSDATHALRMARNVFLGNAHTRLPFPGVAALFRALYRGASGAEMNPLFFLSSSPWNLYDLFIQFFRLQEIPGDPVLFLRDWGITHEEILPLNHRRHKIRIIRRMLDFYPNLPFILVGDSGQADPEVYAEMVAAFPDRILAVYIRNIVRDLKRPEAVRELAKEVVNAGSTLVLADDSLAIARHAVEIGLIDAAALPSIGEDKRKDTAPPTTLEKILGDEAPEEGVTVEVDSESSPEAIEDGMIEDTMKEQGKDTTKQPPTVVVQDQQARRRAQEKIEKEAGKRKEEN